MQLLQLRVIKTVISSVPELLLHQYLHLHEPRRLYYEEVFSLCEWNLSREPWTSANLSSETWTSWRHQLSHICVSVTETVSTALSAESNINLRERSSKSDIQAEKISVRDDLWFHHKCRNYLIIDNRLRYVNLCTLSVKWFNLSAAGRVFVKLTAQLLTCVWININHRSKRGSEM